MPGGALRRLTCIAAALVLGAAAPAAAAAQPRIINGSAADPGEYPAQGSLRFQVGAQTFLCGGTLLTSTKLITAAHCATDDNGAPLAPGAFTVRLGSNTRDSGGTVHTVSRNEVHEDFSPATLDDDVAILTLTTAASQTPLALIRPDQTALWEPDDPAWIIGWGVTEKGTASQQLLEADVPMRSDAMCGGVLAYDTDFHPATMVCAGGGGTANDSDTCSGDSGGPLMVPATPPFSLVGITSWGDVVCNSPTKPGVYTRLGAPALNAWVRGRRAGLDFSVTPPVPTAGQPATLTATSESATGYTWDLNGDGVFGDATGASTSQTFPSAGDRRVTVRAADADAQPAERFRTVAVAAAPAPSPTPTPTPTPTPAPTAAPIPLPHQFLATITAARRPKVRRGRFTVRISFARTAPRGTAVVEALRGARRIGSGRTRVRRGASKRVTVKLTSRGNRLLRRSASKRLRVRIRVRVGRRVLRSKTLTIRR
jgi:secreted trypsin-like serine protease